MAILSLHAFLRLVPLLRILGCPTGCDPMAAAEGGVPGPDLYQRGQHAVENLCDLEQHGGKGWFPKAGQGSPEYMVQH